MLAPTRNLISALLLAMILDALLRDRRLSPLDRTEIWMLAFSIIMLASAFLIGLRQNQVCAAKGGRAHPHVILAMAKES